MSCKHENADHLMPGEGWATMDGDEMPVTGCEQLRCIDCGAWLSLGAANDDVPADELRLAEHLSIVAERWGTEGCADGHVGFFARQLAGKKEG